MVAIIRAIPRHPKIEVIEPERKARSRRVIAPLVLGFISLVAGISEGGHGGGRPPCDSCPAEDGVDGPYHRNHLPGTVTISGKILERIADVVIVSGRLVPVNDDDAVIVTGCRRRDSCLRTGAKRIIVVLYPDKTGIKTDSPKWYSGAGHCLQGFAPKDLPTEFVSLLPVPVFAPCSMVPKPLYLGLARDPIREYQVTGPQLLNPCRTETMYINGRLVVCQICDVPGVPVVQCR